MTANTDDDNIEIIGGDGPTDNEQDGEGKSLTDLVEQPAKVMRIGSMIRQLLEEVKAAPLDEASHNRLRAIHKSSIKELESGLAPELVEELERLSLPFNEEQTPSESELRIAQAQLVGWLEGLFHGIQTALFAQQMSALVVPHSGLAGRRERVFHEARAIGAGAPSPTLCEVR